MNRVCKVLGIEKPIIQGPMAWISTAPLVAAVSNAGALGVLGVGFAPDGFVIEQVAATRKLTDKPFGINTIMIPENLDRLTGIIGEIKPPIVYADTLFELPQELCNHYFSQWHSFGCKVIVKVADLKNAITAEKSGADVVVVKGWEGGGHVTSEATMVLVPQAADMLSIPVIASGGIADGRGFAAAIAMGADGIEMGTAFMAAAESTVHPNVKQAVVAADDGSTVITGMSTGEPCRQIANKLSEELDKIEAQNTRTAAADLLRPVAESSLKKAMAEGDMENGAVMIGQIVPLVKEIRPVAETIDTVLSEAKARLKQITDFTF